MVLKDIVLGGVKHLAVSRSLAQNGLGRSFPTSRISELKSLADTKLDESINFSKIMHQYSSESSSENVLHSFFNQEPSRIFSKAIIHKGDNRDKNLTKSEIIEELESIESCFATPTGPATMLSWLTIMNMTQPSLDIVPITFGASLAVDNVLRALSSQKMVDFLLKVRGDKDIDEKDAEFEELQFLKEVSPQYLSWFMRKQSLVPTTQIEAIRDGKLSLEFNKLELLQCLAKQSESHEIVTLVFKMSITIKEEGKNDDADMFFPIAFESSGSLDDSSITLGDEWKLTLQP